MSSDFIYFMEGFRLWRGRGVGYDGLTGTDLIDFSTADIESTIKVVNFTLDKASRNKQVRLLLLTRARKLFNS